MFQGIYPTDNFNAVDALIISGIAMLLVFLVLITIIAVTHGIKVGTNKADDLLHINPRNPSNKLLSEDHDAVVAALVATIDFHKETKQNAQLKSIERIDE